MFEHEKRNFLAIFKAKVCIFYFRNNFRVYWAVVTEYCVYAKVSNLSAGILNDISAFSPVIDILKN